MAALPQEFAFVVAVASSPWTWPVAIVVALTSIFVGVGLIHRQWKRGWLSGLIDARLAEIRGRHTRHSKRRPKTWHGTWNHARLSFMEGYDSALAYVRTILPTNASALHVPTFVSFTIVAAIIAVFFLVARWPAIDWVFPPPFAAWWASMRQDLDASANGKMGDLVIGAFTGLAVVVIALIVFVAESIRDDRDFERKRILLRISTLWPLAIAATLVPFGFLWAAARGVTIVLEAIVAAVTLFGFARVVRNLLDPEARAVNRIALLRDRTRGLIRESIRERIGNGILMEQLGANKPIEALTYLVSDAFLDRSAQDYIFVDAPKDGWLSDIQLGELAALMRRLDRFARERLGLVLRMPDRQGLRREARGPVGMEPQDNLPRRPAYLMKRFGEQIPPDSIFYARRRALFALPRAFEREPQIIAELEAAIAHIFRFTTAEPTSVQFRREMQATKDQLVSAIRTRAFGSIEDLRLVYVTIAEEFLTGLVDYGGGYSVEQARQERGNIFQSWSEIRWLQDDLRELITVAIDGDNTDVMGTITFLPFAIATRAVLAQDHYLFQQFLMFALFLYYRAMEKPEGPVRAWIVDKAWRYPKEIADFYVGRKLDDAASSVRDLENMQGLALFTFRVLQDLLKGAADQRDPKTFEVIAHELRRLFSNFRDVADPVAAEILEAQIANTADEGEQARLQADCDLLAARARIAAALDLASDEIFLALGGRILGVLLMTPGEERLRSMLDTVRTSLIRDPGKLVQAYAAASDFQASDFWDWHSWDLVADGEAHFIDTHTKLNQMFALRMLELLAEMAPAQRDALVLPQSVNLSEMARENNEQGLLRTLDDIDNNPEKWGPILSGDARALTAVLRGRLAAMREAGRAREAEETRNAHLDPAIVNEFRGAVVRSLRDTARLRAILAFKGALEEKPDDHPGREIPSLGFNQVEDKGPYIAQERTTYAGWGESYGQGLAHSEDAATFGKMIENAGVRRPLLPGAVVDGIAAAAQGLRDAIVLQSLDYAEENEIRRHASFTPKYDERLRTSPLNKLNGFMGELAVGERRIPIFDIFVRVELQKGKVIVMDAAKFLRWRQYAPDDAPEERPFANAMVLVRVWDLNADGEQRDKIIASRPDWLEQQADKVAHLRGRVLVNVYEKFRIDILDAAQGCCFSIARDRPKG